MHNHSKTMNFIQPNNITFCKPTFKYFHKHVQDWDHRKTSHGYFSIFPSYNHCDYISVIINVCYPSPNRSSLGWLTKAGGEWKSSKLGWSQARFMYKWDKLQIRASHYKGTMWGCFTKRKKKTESTCNENHDTKRISKKIMYVI